MKLWQQDRLLILVSKRNLTSHFLPFKPKVLVRLISGSVNYQWSVDHSNLIPQLSRVRLQHKAFLTLRNVCSDKATHIPWDQASDKKPPRPPPPTAGWLISLLQKIPKFTWRKKWFERNRGLDCHPAALYSCRWQTGSAWYTASSWPRQDTGSRHRHLLVDKGKNYILF